MLRAYRSEIKALGEVLAPAVERKTGSERLTVAGRLRVGQASSRPCILLLSGTSPISVPSMADGAAAGKYRALGLP